MRGVADTARVIYDAYVAKDRGAAERLLAVNFRFTSASRRKESLGMFQR